MGQQLGQGGQVGTDTANRDGPSGFGREGGKKFNRGGGGHTLGHNGSPA
jgi:hypothetical protein